MEIITINCGMLDTNCYIIHDGSDAVVIDPADEAEKILSFLDGLHLRAVLLTHGHFDHILAVGTLRKMYPGIPVYACRDEKDVLSDPYLNASFMSRFEPVTADVWLREGDELDLAGLHFKVLQTPGHTIGSICFYFEEEK